MMDDLYTAPRTRQLDGVPETPNLARTGAITAIQVAAAYAVLLLVFGLSSENFNVSQLLFWGVTALLSMLVAVVITVAYGAMINALLGKLKLRKVVWFNLAVLIPVIVLAVIATLINTPQLFSFAAVLIGYGLPIAWIASRRLLDQERQYQQVGHPLP